MVTLFSKAPGGTDIRVQLQERAPGGLLRKPGERLFLSFGPSNTHINQG